MERCDHCERQVTVRLPCLGRRLCFACMTAVIRLTSRFPALREIAASEAGEALRRIPAPPAPER